MSVEALLGVQKELPKPVLMALLESLVEPLSASLPQPSEVVLHDLDALPNSIVAIAGSLTGRCIGGAGTDLLLRRRASGTLETLVGYSTKLSDGRNVRSTTIVLNDDTGKPAAALCLNIDVTPFEMVRAWADSMVPSGETSTVAVDAVPQETETFVTDLDELGTQILADAIATVNVPADLMRKKHKLAVVRELRTKGFFLLKESVETAAKALGVTRFTIYNYLNELAEDED